MLCDRISAIIYAEKAIKLCEENRLSGRCLLLKAVALRYESVIKIDFIYLFIHVCLIKLSRIGYLPESVVKLGKNAYLVDGKKLLFLVKVESKF